MVDTHRIYEWMAHPEALGRDSLYDLRALIARYPYFQTARILYLRNLVALHSPDLADELRLQALYVADRKQLFRLIEDEKLRVMQAEEAPADESVTPDRTLELIDAFLSREEATEDEKLPVGLETDRPATDVKTEEELDEEEPDEDEMDEVEIDEEEEEDIPSDEEDEEETDGDLLENESSAAEDEAADEADDEQEAPAAETAEEDPEESYFTETLAKIYIKQQRYSKALEIIKKLYLKYPKKNVYFADQIRFLEKLIINNKSK